MARMSRKELKQPDQFVESGQEALKWMVDHQRQLTMGAGGVLGLLLLFGGLSAINSSRAVQANQELAVALTKLQGEDKDAAAEALEIVGEQWSGNVATIAKVFAAQARLRGERPASAKEAFEAAAGSGIPALEQQVQVGLAAAAEAAEDWKEAASRYAAAAIDAQGPYTADAVLGEARSRERLGEKEKAKELYEYFKAEFPEAPEVAFASSKIESLGS